MEDETHDLEALLKLCIASSLRPRSQTPFGNALAGETLFRWRDAGGGYARSLGNGVAQTSAFPNRVWERGNEGGKLMDDNFPPVA